jgi:hypothetical protein
MPSSPILVASVRDPTFYGGILAITSRSLVSFGALCRFLLFFQFFALAASGLFVDVSTSSGKTVLTFTDESLTLTLRALDTETHSPQGFESLFAWTPGYFEFGVSAILYWRTAYTGTSSETYDFSVFTNLFSDAHDFPACAKLSEVSGFSAISDPWTLQFLFSEPMLLPASRFWFGANSDLAANHDTQVNAQTFTGDSAMSVSWLGLQIAPQLTRAHTTCVSFMVRAGTGSVHAPTFSLESVDPSVVIGNAFFIRGSLHSEDNEQMTVFAVMDDDCSHMVQVVSNYDSGTLAEYVPFDQLTFGIENSPGCHIIMFYAMTAAGTFSNSTPSVSFSTAPGYTGTVYFTLLPGRPQVCPGTPAMTPMQSALIDTVAATVGSEPTPGPPEDNGIPTYAIVLAVVGGVVVVAAVVGGVIWVVKPCRRPKVEPQDSAGQGSSPGQAPPPGGDPQGYGSAPPGYAGAPPA